MNKLSYLALVFAVAFAVFFLLLIFFRIPFPPYPLMSYQDAFDILTPLVIIPLYWLMFRLASNRVNDRSGEVAFILLAAVWVSGHGMHLSANSIDNLVEGLAESQVIDITGTSIYQLIYFFDEHLSHYLRDIGILGLAALLMVQEWRHPSGAVTIWWATVTGAVIYGFTYFCIFLEGQTVPLGLPFAGIVSIMMFFYGIRKLDQRPLLAFFCLSCLIATILFTGWGLFWQGFPQFTDVGLI